LLSRASDTQRCRAQHTLARWSCEFPKYMDEMAFPNA
jgi:hypothetical protein